jgi:rhodanese-related sulfurtransferase
MLRRLFGTPESTAWSAWNATELKQKLDAGEELVLVDVRSADEFTWNGHIAGSRLLPLPDLGTRLDEIPTDQTVVMVCRSGSRSQIACRQLSRMGYTNLVNLDDGMIGWTGAGYPVSR